MRRGGALSIFLGLVWATAARAQVPMNFLEGHGVRAEPVTPLTWGVTLISIVVIIVICAMLLAALLRQRLYESSVRDLVSPRPKDLGLVYWGVGVTTATLFAVTVWTMLSLSALSRTPENLSPVTLEVIGHQWWWELRYHDGDPAQDFATANEIHIPVGQAVRVVLRSADVIHSFWIPQLAGKTDLIPGQINETWLHADREGVYRGQCGEFCGKQHAHMALLVIAEPQEKFDRWRNGQLQSTPAATGLEAKHDEQAFVQKCGACHAVRGTTANGVYGPNLSHLASRTTIAAGALPNTQNNLSAWIADPQKFKPGSLMPPLELTEDQENRVVRFLEKKD